MFGPKLHVCLMVTIVVGHHAVCATADVRPNIIFILVDDAGWGDLTAYGGHPKLQTPHLDRLGRQGAVFKQFYVNAPKCSPSRAALMTGLFPAQLRIHREIRNNDPFLDPRVMTVTRLLQQSGYTTALFGKWHLGQHKQHAPPPGDYGIDVHRTTHSTGPNFNAHKTDKFFKTRSTDLFVDEAIRFIETHRDGPFYLNLWTEAPHNPLIPTPEQLDPYKAMEPGRREYYAVMTAMDAAIGRFLVRLDELMLTQNTIVIFSSDNGPAWRGAWGSNGSFRGRKQSLYEGGIRMPFIVRWPGRIAAERVDTESVIADVDLLPTLCALANVALPDGMSFDGEDVSDMLLERARPRRASRSCGSSGFSTPIRS